MVIPSVTREQMIEIDRLAMEETGPNIFQMMENAGRNLAEFCINFLGNKSATKNIIVLSGSGNNGGGGICAARHLTNHGGNVMLVLSDVTKLNKTALQQKIIFDNAGGKSVSFDKLKNINPDLIIDSLIGYNLKGSPTGRIKEMIAWTNSFKIKIISLDIPSGLDANTGIPQGEYIKADSTVTLALPKIGLQNGNSGNIFLADIGIPKTTFEKIGIDYHSPFSKSYVVPLNRI